MPDIDNIDGLSDREIARKTYEKVCEVEQQVESVRERVSENEDVTQPIKNIASSAWNKLVFSLGWGVLITIALLVYYLLKLLDKIPS